MSLPLRFPYPPMEAESVPTPCRADASGSTSPSGTGSAASPFATASRCASRARPASRWAGTSRTWSRRWRPLPPGASCSTGRSSSRWTDASRSTSCCCGCTRRPAGCARWWRRTRPGCVVFDLLVDERGRSLVELPLAERRERLEALRARRYFRRGGRSCSRRPRDALATARDWLAGGGRRPRRRRGQAAGSAVSVGRARRHGEGEAAAHGRLRGRRIPLRSKGGGIGSLLLGLYDGEGLLNHVGFCSSLDRLESARASRKKLERLRQPPGFTGRAPGGPSRWSTERSAEWEPLAPQARRGGGVRSCLQRPVPPRHQVRALAAGQGTESNAPWSSCE